METIRQDEERLTEVLTKLERHLADCEPEAVREFARRLLGRAPAARLEEAEPGLLAGEAARLFRLIERTPHEAVAVEVETVEGRPRRAVVRTVMADCAFIVETLQELLATEPYAVRALLHPILAIERGPDGRIQAVLDRSSDAPRVSATLVLVEGPFEPGSTEALEQEVRRRLEHVRLATRDFDSMLAAARGVAEDLERMEREAEWRAEEIREIRELLAWLTAGNFVFLGFRDYDVTSDGSNGRSVQVRRGSSLGILSDESSSKAYDPVPLTELAPELQARILGGPLLIVSKTNALSPVHRRARMDDIAIKKLGSDGEVVGERRFLGLFTAKAFAQDASATPILRRKLTEILELEQVEPGTHDHGLIVRVFNSLPKEDLFGAAVSELRPVVEAVMETHATDDVFLVARPDPVGRGATVMVVMPRHRFSAEVRQRVQRLLVDEYDGQVLNYHLTLGESRQARLHFHIAADSESVGRVDPNELRSRVGEAIRSWPEKVLAGLEDEMSPDEAAELIERYGEAFPPEYSASTSVRTAVRDIRALEHVRVRGRRRITLEELDPPEPDRYWLTAFDRGVSFVLSDVMPVLENLGFRVIRAEAYELRVRGEDEPLTIHSFLVDVPPEWNVDRASAEPRVEEALHAVRMGWAENLAINRLILSAGFEWRQVAVLKAYGAYAFRIGAVSSRLSLRRAISYPEAARLLYEIFVTLFDPHLVGEREPAVAALLDEFGEALNEVKDIEDDRTLRRLLNLILSTVRTNCFQPRFTGDPETPIALKFDCGRVEVMPRPRPRHEIWVNSARTEGAHLRMGDVARGGLRWSDRTEDFRVEVLGLVKTQQVKNAVIVPAGAKGAFVVSRPPADRAELREAGVTSYRDFVSALLDVTDNVVDGVIVSPPATVVRDGPDPYLVVAADKGTASLSDTANALAERYGFWLGDAFASGGSRGYDHKALGITARGAWECVKRHFREMGKDIQEEEFSVVGIGDMSGDVFGNGMLLSRKIRLLAAFDHRNIFIDPDPDPEVSWTERKRLFDGAGTAWTDYDPALISEGGGVWGRGDKRIDLSPQARDVLGIEEEVLNGDALIQAILRAPVELVWNGGIGTYVRASSEPDAEVGDPGNDRVRITAPELRARVIGEGGNLGLTQRARIEYARAGGRINTDALDNSAGVDTSDHEVNIKILLASPVGRGELSGEARDELMTAAADDVAAAVLRNSASQSQAVSLDQHRVQRSPAAFFDALRSLEREGLLDRKLEVLPTTEAMAERLERHEAALVRPELAVLLAYAKLHLKSRLAGSSLLRDPAMLKLVRSYFPPAILEAAGPKALEEHRLQANIASTVLTNRFIDLMGGAGLIQLTGESNRDATEVVKAWLLAHEVADAGTLLEDLYRSEGATAGVQVQWLLEASEALARATRWLLANADLGRPLSELILWFGEPVRELRSTLADLLPEARRLGVGDRMTMHRSDGMAGESSWRLVCLQFLDGLLPVASIANEAGVSATTVGEIYFGLSQDIDFPWLQERLTSRGGDDLWDQRAARGLSIDLEAARRSVVSGMVSRLERGAGGPGDPMAEFRDRQAAGLRRIRALIDELKEEGQPDLAPLMVAVRTIADHCEAWNREG